MNSKFRCNPCLNPWIISRSNGQSQFPLHCFVFSRGEVIFSQDTPAAGCYMVCHGEIKLIYRSFHGRKHILDFVHPTDFLGSEVLFDETYTFSAEATKKSRLFFISKADLLNLICKHPQIEQKICQGYVKEFIRFFERVMARIDHGPQLALANGLLQLAGHPNGHIDDTAVELKRTVEELAEYILFSRRSTLRALDGLKEKRLVHRHRQGSLMLHVEGLKKLCEL